MKRCSKCKKSLPLSEYYRDKSEAKGYTHACKSCRYKRKTLVSEPMQIKAKDFLRAFYDVTGVYTHPHEGMSLEDAIQQARLAVLVPQQGIREKLRRRRIHERLDEIILESLALAAITDSSTNARAFYDWHKESKFSEKYEDTNNRYPFLDDYDIRKIKKREVSLDMLYQFIE